MLNFAGRLHVPFQNYYYDKCFVAFFACTWLFSRNHLPCIGILTILSLDFLTDCMWRFSITTLQNVLLRSLHVLDYLAESIYPALEHERIFYFANRLHVAFQNYYYAEWFVAFFACTWLFSRVQLHRISSWTLLWIFCWQIAYDISELLLQLMLCYVLCMTCLFGKTFSLHYIASPPSPPLPEITKFEVVLAQMTSEKLELQW